LHSLKWSLIKYQGCFRVKQELFRLSLHACPLMIDDGGLRLIVPFSFGKGGFS